MIKIEKNRANSIRIKDKSKFGILIYEKFFQKLDL